MSNQVDATARNPISVWPELRLSEWEDTHDTLHMWTQIVGKIRLVQSPWICHSWHVTLYVTARGLTTSTHPLRRSTFEIDFDFIDHQLICRSATVALPPGARTADDADFYGRLMDESRKLGLHVNIHGKPEEVAEPIRFDQDQVHCSYDADYAHRFWRILVQADRVFKQFRAVFIGKCSPVHFFWGGPDLAVTRFSGRRAPEHPGGIPNLPDWITREAYSATKSAAAASGPAGARLRRVLRLRVSGTGWIRRLRRSGPTRRSTAASLGSSSSPTTPCATRDRPNASLLEFLQTTYEAAADLASWPHRGTGGISLGRWRHARGAGLW